MGQRIVSADEAYWGEIGQKRARFCADFLARKPAAFERIQREIFAQITARGEQATCRAGCPACCVMYVQADIQEAEAIVYYLYQHRERLISFLQRFGEWGERMRRAGEPFGTVEAIMREQREEQATRAERDKLLQVMFRYHEAAIPCAFLVDGSCGIYPARPCACANHYVTTPSEWCRPERWKDPANPKPRFYLTDVSEIGGLEFYHGKLARARLGFMQIMVHRILTGGLHYVAAATGLNDLVPATVGKREV